MRNVRIVLGTELSCFYPAVGVFIVEKEMQVFLLQIAKLHHSELGRRWLGGRAALFASLRTHRDPRLPEIDCAFHDLWLTATCVFRLCVLAFVWPSSPPASILAHPSCGFCGFHFYSCGPPAQNPLPFLSFLSMLFLHNVPVFRFLDTGGSALQIIISERSPEPSF